MRMGRPPKVRNEGRITAGIQAMRERGKPMPDERLQPMPECSAALRAFVTAWGG